MAPTKEPWRTGGDGTIVYDTEGWAIAIAAVFHGRREPEKSKENARRIVACVNACAGISTTILEGATFEEIIVAAILQRDKLAAALPSIGLKGRVEP